MYEILQKRTNAFYFTPCPSTAKPPSTPRGKKNYSHYSSSARQHFGPLYIASRLRIILKPRERGGCPLVRRSAVTQGTFLSRSRSYILHANNAMWMSTIPLIFRLCYVLPGTTYCRKVLLAPETANSLRSGSCNQTFTYDPRPEGAPLLCVFCFPLLDIPFPAFCVTTISFPRTLRTMS